MKKCLLALMLLMGLATGAVAEDHFNLTPSGLNFHAFDNKLQASAGGIFFMDTAKLSSNALNVNPGTWFSEIETFQNVTYDKVWNIYLEEHWLEHHKMSEYYLGYTLPTFQAMAGQIPLNFGLNNNGNIEDLDDLTFSMPSNAFAPPNALGAAISVNNEKWALGLDAAGRSTSQNYKGHPPRTYVGRLIYVPFHRLRDVLHFGVDLYYQKPSGSNTWSFATGPDLNMPSDVAFVDTGTVSNISHFLVGDLEFAYQLGSMTLQSEYTQTYVKRRHHGKSLKFSGYDVSLGYFLTGETRQYSYPGGYFVQPSKILHHYGAFQLVGALSNVDLDSRDVRGGNETNATAMVDWYFTNQVALKLAYTRVFNRLFTTGEHNDFNIIALQLQFGLFND
jgi:phosphate-selective porin